MLAIFVKKKHTFGRQMVFTFAVDYVEMFSTSSQGKRLQHREGVAIVDLDITTPLCAFVCVCLPLCVRERPT